MKYIIPDTITCRTQEDLAFALGVCVPPLGYEIVDPNTSPNFYPHNPPTYLYYICETYVGWGKLLVKAFPNAPIELAQKQTQKVVQVLYQDLVKHTSKTLYERYHTVWYRDAKDELDRDLYRKQRLCQRAT